MKHPDVQMVTFTGSPSVGEQIARNAEIKTVTRELGNSSANIVHKDVDVALVAHDLAMKAYLGGAVLHFRSTSLCA